MAKKPSIKRIPKQLMSKKVFGLLVNDFSFLGNVPFYLFVMLVSYFSGNIELFNWLAYTFVLGIIVVFSIKSIHYKDRPQKEEFNIFIEKMLASSFPSSHSLSVTVIAIYIILMYPYQWVIIMSVFACMIVYIQRYITKKHFVVDIIGGILVAFAIAIFVVKVL
jgi:membrane-associated phospholipid phosphatase